MQNNGDFQVSKRGTGVGFLVEKDMMKMNMSFAKEKHQRQRHMFWLCREGGGGEEENKEEKQLNSTV